MTELLSERRQKWVGSLLFLLLVAIGSVWVWRIFGEQTRTEARWKAKATSPIQNEKGTVEGSVLAVFGPAPAFSLTERSNAPFSNSNLGGKPWVANFIFTNCAGQCPLMSLQMKRLQNQWPQEGGFQFVSFTVDPKRDTPEVLSQYADRYGAVKDRWFFLTGPQKEINRILKGFFLSEVEVPAMHSTRFILVDQRGSIRGYYDSTDPGSMDQLMHDAKILLVGA